MSKMKKTKKLTLVNGFIVVCVALLVIGAGAKLIGLMNGTQETEVSVDGAVVAVTFDGQPLNDLIIPGDNVGTISAGETKTFTHYINVTGSDNYKIYFDIDDSWFTDTNHDYYGLTYGVTYEGTEIANTELYCGVGSDEGKTVTFWYTAHADMIQPTNPIYCHNWVNSTKVV